MKPIRVFSLAALVLTTQLHAKPLLDEMQNAHGTHKVCERVWISSFGSADEERIGKITAGFGASENGPKIGPELTFGLYMQKFTDASILIIKTAWDDKRLNTDFRPPSAGPYVFKKRNQRASEEALQGKQAQACGGESLA
jgi:hypothetical protein